MIAAVLKLLGIQRNVDGMQNEFEYPKSEEVIEIGETPPPEYLPTGFSDQ